MLLAVTGYRINNGVGVYHCVSVADDYSACTDNGWIDERAVVNCVINGFTPVNFSITRDRKVKQDCGDFARFSQLGSAVVVAELRSKSGRNLGYKLLSCANNILVNIKTEDILQKEVSFGDNEHFLQNGIIRNKTVNCYPLKPFPVITINTSKAKQQKSNVAPERQNNSKKQNFTAEQLNEITLCEKNGINSRFIKNSKLSPSQMRVLWVSKSKGALSERFANPQLSVEAMKFYADRLYDKNTADECADMLKHTELSVPELTELYSCICQGLPYESYIGLSATDIQVKRDQESVKYWGSASKFDVDYYEKAMNVAMKIKGY